MAQYAWETRKDRRNRFLYWLKYPFKFLLYAVLDQVVVSFIRPIPSKKVLLFRLDLIGDYLLTSPFLQIFKTDPKWKEFSIHFVGNQIVQDLAQNLNGPDIDSFYFIDRKRFINSIHYRFKVLAWVRREGFDWAINLSHTRQYWLESIIRVSGASQRICSSPVGVYMNKLEQSISNDFYNRCIDTGSQIQFEFDRNRTFFSALSPLADSISLNQARLTSTFPKTRLAKGEPFLLLVAPGASSALRKWPAAFFSKLLLSLKNQFQIQIAFIGGKEEVAFVNQILELGAPGLKDSQNFAGCLPLLRSFEKISEANFLLSNESSPVHYAALSGTPCLCLSQGNHFGRWNPYPKELAGWIETLYPPFFGDPETEAEILKTSYHSASYLPMDAIPVSLVLETLFKRFKQMDVSLNSLATGDQE